MVYGRLSRIENVVWVSDFVGVKSDALENKYLEHIHRFAKIINIIIK